MQDLDASGGTAIGSWLNAASTLFSEVEATQRHAILLTDGKNESEHASVLDRAVEAAQGVFQCDCRGVGADWDVNELRDIASALLGTVDIIPEPERMADDFRADDAGIDGAWRRRRHAPGLGPAGRRGAVRAAGRTHDRGAHRPGGRRPAPLVREYPDRIVGRRVP